MNIQSLLPIERYALFLLAFLPRRHETKTLFQLMRKHVKGGDERSVVKLCDKLKRSQWLIGESRYTSWYRIGGSLGQEAVRELAAAADRGNWWPSQADLNSAGDESDLLRSFRGYGDFDYTLLDVLKLMWCGEGEPFSLTAEKFLSGPHGRDVLRAAASATVRVIGGEPTFDESLFESPAAGVLPYWMNAAFASGLPLSRTMDFVEAHARKVDRIERDLAEMYSAIALWRGEVERIDIPSINASSGLGAFVECLADGKLALADKSAQYHGIGNFLSKDEDVAYDDIPRRYLFAMVCLASKPDKMPKTRPMRLFRGNSKTSHEYAHEALYDYECLDIHLSNTYWRMWKDVVAGKGPALAAHASAIMTPLDVLLCAWDYRMLAKSRARYASKTAFLAVQARTIAENGYMTLSRLVFALLNGGYDRRAFQQVLATVEEKGLPLVKPVEAKPQWREFLSALKKAVGKAESSGKAESPGKRLLWYVKLRKEDEGGGWEVVSVYPAIRPDGGDDGGKDDEIIDPYYFRVSKYRNLMTEKDLVVAMTLEAQRSARGTVQLLRDLVGMKNLLRFKGTLEREYNRYGSPISVDVSRGVYPLEIRKGRFFAETASTEDGGFALALPSWMGAGFSGKSFVRKVSDGVFELIDLSPGEIKLVKALQDYGPEGRVVLPQEAMKTAEPLLESLGSVMKLAEAGVDGETELPRVAAKNDVVVRLSFDGTSLRVRAVVLPIADNAAMTLDPGVGQSEKLISGAVRSYVLVRNLEAERESFKPVENALAEFGDWFDGRSSWFFDDLAAALSALMALKSANPRIPLEWLDERRLAVAQSPKSSVALGAQRTAEDWFRVDGEFHLDDGRVLSLMEVVSAMANRAGDFVRLSDGDYLALTKDMARQLEALRSAGRRDGDGLDISKAAVPMLDGVFGGGGESLDLPEEMAKSAEEIRDVFQRRPSVPKNLNAELRPYQTEGFMWLSRLASCGFGSCLADDMGLGKTVQVIALLLERAADGPSLVVAPSSVCGNWRREIVRFAPTLRPVMAWEYGDGLSSDAQVLKPNSIVIASYGYLLFHEKAFSEIAWNGVVLDEAQAIKNDASKRAHVVKELKSRFRVAATGTPVENRLGELWSLFDFLNPGLLGPSSSFAQRLTRDGMATSDLKRLVRPLILRRLKGDVLDDLPEKTEVTVPIELGTAERTAYEACRRHALAVLESEGGKDNRISILAELTRLRRFCCHPSLVMGSNEVPSAKMEALLGILEGLRLSGHRALVFSQFTDYLAIVRKTLAARGWTHCYLDGSTPTPERARLVDAFQSGEGDFFVISLKAGGTGLNLTAADYVILLDPWWNPAVENQAADRAHRIGQKRPVTVYRLIASDTVEERVLELHREKQALAEDVLDGTSSSALSPAELMRLFG